MGDVTPDLGVMVTMLPPLIDCCPGGDEYMEGERETEGEYIEGVADLATGIL